GVSEFSCANGPLDELIGKPRQYECQRNCNDRGRVEILVAIVTPNCSAENNQNWPMPQIQRIAIQPDENQFGVCEHVAIEPGLRARPNDEEGSRRGQQGPPPREGLFAGKTDPREDEQHPYRGSEIAPRQCQ